VGGLQWGGWCRKKGGKAKKIAVGVFPNLPRLSTAHQKINLLPYLLNSLLLDIKII
jgi:hypothetical protein